MKVGRQLRDGGNVESCAERRNEGGDGAEDYDCESLRLGEGRVRFCGGFGGGEGRIVE